MLSLCGRKEAQLAIPGDLDMPHAQVDLHGQLLLNSLSNRGNQLLKHKGGSLLADLCHFPYG